MIRKPVAGKLQVFLFYTYKVLKTLQEPRLQITPLSSTRKVCGDLVSLFLN
jgi:hypothetical protein